ncbi:hypothetical protein Agub_g4937 [Astrephomene gubernaculifera]|uniref:Uncharacterized protein n=1 Tax=Astrephomene gubernaculifera TaxID=47775 RepID=A0AAD3DNP2_9CHLO|nr:hypothetical protein Agub_g4937 [Astrephomene gubernaculifera]
MPPRPEGTDGSDWSYREVVADRYKRMAVNMSATFFMHQVQSAVLVLKLLWYLFPVVAEERRPDPFFFALLAFLVVGNICFYAGRPRGRCVLPLMKVAALLVMATLGLHFVSLWKYHLLEPKTSQYGRRLYKLLRDRGTLESPTWLTVFTAAEGVLDAALVAAAGTCFFIFNNWVRDAMQAAKERQQRGKQQTAAGAAAGGGAVAGGGRAVRRRA